LRGTLGHSACAFSRPEWKAGISADMALRLSEAFNTDPELWLRLQLQRNIGIASKKKRAQVKPLSAAA
jgi:plasmid maintenance system antidote protein VapI